MATPVRDRDPAIPCASTAILPKTDAFACGAAATRSDGAGSAARGAGNLGSTASTKATELNNEYQISAKMSGAVAGAKESLQGTDAKYRISERFEVKHRHCLSLVFSLLFFVAKIVPFACVFTDFLRG